MSCEAPSSQLWCVRGLFTIQQVYRFITCVERQDAELHIQMIICAVSNSKQCLAFTNVWKYAVKQLASIITAKSHRKKYCKAGICRTQRVAKKILCILRFLSYVSAISKFLSHLSYILLICVGACSDHSLIGWTQFCYLFLPASEAFLLFC